MCGLLCFTAIFAIESSTETIWSSKIPVSMFVYQIFVAFKQNLLILTPFEKWGLILDYLNIWLYFSVLRYTLITNLKFVSVFCAVLKDVL